MQSNKGILEKRRLVRMNLDDELRDLQQGEARYFLNCRVGNSDNDNQGDVENVKGNLLADPKYASQMPAGTNKCIGSYEDLQNKRIFYFVYNDQGNHGIYELNCVTDTITPLLVSSILNFQTDYLITGIVVVNNLLYWTDNYNEPMKIDVEKAKLSPSNGGYPNPIILDYIYAIKPPQLCQPDVVYRTDSAKNTNYLKQKLFQFKTRYVYDNNEKSVTSPISEIPYPQTQTCGINNQVTDNCIDIIIETGNAIVKEIEIFARDSNESTSSIAEFSSFYTIAILNKQELGLADNAKYTYTFYNDKNYLPLDIVRSVQLQDFVPLKAKAEELIDGNKLVYGNIEEGFDPVDVKAKINVAVENEIKINQITIRGRLYIGNPFAANFSNRYSQPITNTGGYATFGGFDGGVVTNNAGSSYGQTLPLGGFVVYLAGTNYFDITEQNLAGLATDPIYGSQNVYDASGSSAQQLIQNKVDDYGKGNPQVYSTYNITGVTEGKYILRFADHNTQQSELYDGTLNYQKRSTYTTQVGGKQGHEITIEFKTVNGVPTAFVDNVQRSIVNGVLDLTSYGDSIIFDLTQPLDPFFTSPTSGSVVNQLYLVDKDFAFTGINLYKERRINLAKVNWGVGSIPDSNWASTIDNSWVTNNWENSISYTDHNGFTFIAYQKAGITSTNQTSVIADSGANITCHSYTDAIYNNVGISIGNIDWTSRQMQQYIIQNATGSTGSGSLQQFGRTLIQGYVYDSSGNPASNTNIQLTRGGGASTDSAGFFEIYAYGDHSQTNLGYSRSDIVCYSLKGGTCYGSFDKYSDSFSAAYSPSYSLGAKNAIVPKTSQSNYFILTAPYPKVTFGNTFGVGLKRGSTYEYGIVYYDHGLRNGTTQSKDYLNNDINHNYGLKVYIPYYTDINPATNSVWDGSKPVLSWAIANTPPDWATHYQWVRTLRSSVSSYLQWTIQSVIYFDITPNSPIPSNVWSTAKQIELNFNSIIGANTSGYLQRNVNSILTYSFTPGDRLRVIRHSDQSYFPQYFDMEIKGTNPSDKLKLIVPNNSAMGQLKPGDLVELYTPKFGNISVESDIFYEIGECYEIGTTAQGVKYHKKGSTQATTAQINYNYQDQDPSKTWSYFNIWGYFTPITYNGVTYNSPLTLFGGKHSYKVGDEIVIEQASGYLPELSTSAIVINVQLNQIVVSIEYNSATFNAFANIGGTVYSPATGIFKTGDTYYKVRSIPFSTSGGTNSNDTQPWYIEDPNYSDFWASNYYSIGRPNKIDKQFRKTRRPTTIYYSGSLIQETNINDLNNILDADFRTYESYYGSIQKLHNYNRMLDCYQELKVGRIPVSQKIWKDTVGSSVVATSDDVLNPIDYYAGEYGIGTNPESFSAYGYRRYFLDANRGVFCRLSNDGLTPISEHNFKAHNFFTDQCELLTGLGVPFHVYTVYDQKFTECVVAFERVIKNDKKGSTLLAEGKTISFNEDENSWASFYSYEPEYMVSNDTNIVTFNLGMPWKHNENTVYNNFYGTQYSSIIKFPVNSEPSKEKVFQAISFEDADAWDVFAECPNGMQTTLTAGDFELIKNMRYAYFRNDINSPNQWNISNFFPLLDGQKMQDYVMLVTLTSNQLTFQKLFAVNVMWTPAERSNK